MNVNYLNLMDNSLYIQKRFNKKGHPYYVELSAYFPGNRRLKKVDAERDINSGKNIEITEELIYKRTRAKRVKDDVYLFFKKSDNLFERDLVENSRDEVSIRIRLDLQTFIIRKTLEGLASN